MSSDPDALVAMFNAIKGIIGGLEGKLAFPYQRVGMINALQELSRAPGGKSLNSLASSLCSYLLSCYRDDGSEEAKLAILSAMASWAARTAEVVKPDTLTFLAAGLKEKEILRRAHLRCLRIISKNSDALTGIFPLLEPLLQLVKTGFTKPAHRLDGIFALLVVAMIIAVDTRAEDIMSKERIWQLISQNDSLVVSISLV